MDNHNDSPARMARISDFPLGDTAPWPRSHGVYNVTVTIPIVAHSRSQAKKRVQDMMLFLSAWRMNEQGPHQAALYLYDDPKVIGIEHSHVDTYENRDEIGMSMYSDREFIFDWLDPTSDADYDPFALAEKTYFCHEEDDE